MLFFNPAYPAAFIFGLRIEHYPMNSEFQYHFLFFLTAIWLSHSQLWAIIEGKASLTQCSSLYLSAGSTQRPPRAL